MAERKLTWVYVDVVCDLFHAGHVEFFRQARELGDRLVVGLISDLDVASYKRAPIMTYAERAAVVQSCRHVDKVLEAPAPLYCTCDFLDRIGASFACHGNDFAPEEISRWYADLIPSGRVKIVSYTKSISTSAIIDRITKRIREGDLA